MTLALMVEQAAIRMKIEATRYLEMAAAGTTSQALVANIAASCVSKIPEDYDEPSHPPKDVPYDEEEDVEMEPPTYAHASLPHTPFERIPRAAKGHHLAGW